MSEPVRIETARLVLDAPGVADFEPIAAMWADPETTHFVGGPRTRNDSWMRLLRYRGLWPLLGYGYWAVREKASGRFMGDLGFADFQRELTPPSRLAPEAGWVFARWAHGQGFAGEALTAALAWLDGCGVHAQCCCLIAPDNTASVRLASRHGFVASHEVGFHGETTLLLTRQHGASVPSFSTR